ncbi:Beta-amylase 3, chloroplastic [Pelomyxa schiedti]|nr:Beta-amylase 3, chloroplastic [Pelomyxa schiedti]
MVPRRDRNRRLLPSSSSLAIGSVVLAGALVAAAAVSAVHLFPLTAVAAAAPPAAAVDVNVMLPLDVVVPGSGLADPRQLEADLRKLRLGGVDGVMADVWWGLVEPSPTIYDWGAYLQLAEMVRDVGLKLSVVMSFHECGGNVGDSVWIPLPHWVVASASSHGAFYRDVWGDFDKEYISLGADEDETVLGGRSPIQAYEDLMRNFSSTFQQFLGTTIRYIKVGLGPAGELRYPSYQLRKWSYCGVGAFQCYDKYMSSMREKAAIDWGHEEWKSGPWDTGGYNSHPYSTGFFSKGTPNNYESEFGNFFLSWYQHMLLRHADRVLGAARRVFYQSSVQLGAKVAGIHWWYGDQSHAAELTAGYYNTNGHNAYIEIGQVLEKHGTSLDFTCLEMMDTSNDCRSLPEELVTQSLKAASALGMEYAGENALDFCMPVCNYYVFEHINYLVHSWSGHLNQFTFLRLKRALLDDDYNWKLFMSFIQKLHS